MKDGLSRGLDKSREGVGQLLDASRLVVEACKEIGKEGARSAERYSDRIGSLRVGIESMSASLRAMGVSEKDTAGVLMRSSEQNVKFVEAQAGRLRSMEEALRSALESGNTALAETTKAEMEQVETWINEALNAIQKNAEQIPSIVKNASTDVPEQKATGMRTQLRMLNEEIASVTLEYRRMTDAERNSAAGMELKRKLKELVKEAGELRDAMDDVNRLVRGEASDTRNFDAIAQGLNVVTSTAGAATSVFQMFGAKQEDLINIQTKLQATLAISNALSVIQNNLQKESSLMLGIRTIQEKAHATAVALRTAAEGRGVVVTTLATAAQSAFNAVARANPYVLLAGAIATVVGALVAFTVGSKEATEAEKKQREEGERLRKQQAQMADTIGSATGNAVAKYRVLQKQWEALKTSQEKNRWIQENASAFSALGLSVKGVSDAEKVLVSMAPQVIASLKAEARALAYQQLYTDAIVKKAKEWDERRKSRNTGDYYKKVSNSERIQNEMPKEWNDAGLGPEDYTKKSLRASERGPSSSLYTLTKKGEEKLNEYRENQARKLRAQREKEYEDEIERFGKMLDDANEKAIEAKSKIPSNLLKENESKDKGKSSKEIQKLTEAQYKQRKENARRETDLEHETRQARIDAMEEGSAKELAQLQLDFDKRQEALKRGYEDLREKKAQEEKNLFEANPANKDKVFTFDIDSSRYDPTAAETALYDKQKANNLLEYYRKLDDLTADFQTKQQEREEETRKLEESVKAITEALNAEKAKGERGLERMREEERGREAVRLLEEQKAAVEERKKVLEAMPQVTGGEDKEFTVTMKAEQIGTFDIPEDTEFTVTAVYDGSQLENMDIPESAEIVINTTLGKIEQPEIPEEATIEVTAKVNEEEYRKLKERLGEDVVKKVDIETSGEVPAVEDETMTVTVVTDASKLDELKESIPSEVPVHVVATGDKLPNVLDSEKVSVSYEVDASQIDKMNIPDGATITYKVAIDGEDDVEEYVNKLKTQLLSSGEIVKVNEEISRIEEAINAEKAKGNETDSEAVRLLEERLGVAKALLEISKANNEELEFLMKYGDGQTRISAIQQSYTNRITEASAKGDTYRALTLKKQMEEEISSVSFEDLKRKINWEALFGDLSSVTRKELTTLKEQLESFIGSKEFDKAGDEVRRSALEGINAVDAAIQESGGVLASLANARQARANAVERLAKAELEEMQAQITLDIEKGMGNGEKIAKASGDLAEKQQKTDQARKDVQNADKNLKALSDGRLEKLAKEFELLRGALSPVIDLFDSLGMSGVGTVIGGLGDAMSAASSTFSSFTQLKDMFKEGSGIGDLLGNAGPYAAAASAAFSLGKTVYSMALSSLDNHEEMMSVQNEANARLGLIDDHVQEIRSDMGESYGVTAMGKYEELVEALKSQFSYMNTGVQAAGEDRYGGTHSEWWHRNKNGGEDLVAAIGSYYGMDFGDNSLQSFYNQLEGIGERGAEILDDIRRNHQDWWYEMTRDNSYDEGAIGKWVEQWADVAGQLKDAREQLREILSGTTEEDVFSDFMNNVYEFADGAEDAFDDVADSWQRMVNKMVINNLVGQKMKDNLKAWYEKFSKAYDDKEITETEIGDLRDEYERYVEAAKAEIELLRREGVIKATEENTGTRQTGKAGALTTMSQETGSRLEGLFTSGQMHWTSMDEKLTDVSQQIGSACDTLRRIEEHTGSGARSLEEIKADIKIIKRDGLKVK